jgi:iron complex transport system substrate-binding protein
MSHGPTIEAVLARLDGPPRRVVSLVPSYTQSFFDLGFGDAIIGVSDYCTHPAGRLENMCRVGGPKSLRIDKICALRPDLVLANQEENDRDQILALQAAGINVWLTFPRSVKETFSVLADMVRLYGDSGAFMRLRALETGFDWAHQAGSDQARPRYFCPIWQEPGPTGERYWMTFNRDTYSSDLLDQLGGENVFAGRERLYPLEADLGTRPAEASGERDTRYPRVLREEILAAQPEVILLPDEPYRFDHQAESDLRSLLADTPAVQNERIYRVEGRWITWCGTCIGEAMMELPLFLTGSNEEEL